MAWALQPQSTSQAAEGLPRRAFSVAEVERMVQLGLIGDSERVELIGGELVPMAARGARHQLLQSALVRHWTLRSPADTWVLQDATLRLSDDTYLEPDLLVLRREHVGQAAEGSQALIVVEISDSSLGFDLGVKAGLYARFGVPELWVIDAARRTTHVHRAPGEGGYGETLAVPSSSRIIPALVPVLAVALDDIEMP